jgi:hypothetical protein
VNSVAVLLAAAAAVTAACGTLAAAERPAVIARPDARSRAELQRVLAEAFNGRAVALADDALTHDSVLLVERTEPRDAEGRRVGGRVVESPQRFRLVLRDSSCELVRESDGRRWPLASTPCAPNGGSAAP